MCSNDVHIPDSIISQENLTLIRKNQLLKEDLERHQILLKNAEEHYKRSFDLFHAMFKNKYNDNSKVQITKLIERIKYLEGKLKKMSDSKKSMQKYHLSLMRHYHGMMNEQDEELKRTREERDIFRNLWEQMLNNSPKPQDVFSENEEGITTEESASGEYENEFELNEESSSSELFCGNCFVVENGCHCDKPSMEYPTSIYTSTESTTDNESVHSYVDV